MEKLTFDCMIPHCTFNTSSHVGKMVYNIWQLLIYSPAMMYISHSSKIGKLVSLPQV